ncbi:hypothetical protein D9M72_593410 [compost metagenome]
MLRVGFFVALLILTAGYAWWRGGGPERIAAAAMLVATVVSALVRANVRHRFADVDTGLLIVDGLLLIVLVAVALRADRGWPLLVAALHLMTVGAHGIRLIEPGMIPVTYAVLIALWSYPMQVALAIGTWRHQRRIRRFGTDRDWSVRQD